MTEKEKFVLGQELKLALEEGFNSVINDQWERVTDEILKGIRLVWEPDGISAFGGGSGRLLFTVKLEDITGDALDTGYEPEYLDGIASGLEKQAARLRLEIGKK